VLMNQSSRDDTLQGVRPSPGPGRGAVSSQSSRDKQSKRSLPGTAVRREGRAISSHVAWNDIRVEHVARAGGEEAVEAGKREMLAEVIGHRLAEVRRARGLTQQQVADRMGITKGRVSQIERGKVSGHEVLARYAAALGGRLHQAIYFDDGDITAIT
jgi:DNA-binding XRE family transcriptional regulator